MHSNKQMIINANASEEIRVAIVEGERLVDLDIDNTSRSKQKGNIYKGIVANVEDSLEAAFIEFGDEKQAFLALSEIRPSIYPAELQGQRRPKISDVLKRGQEIVVQGTKDEMGNKGAAVTTYLALPGRGRPRVFVVARPLRARHAQPHRGRRPHAQHTRREGA